MYSFFKKIMMFYYYYSYGFPSSLSFWTARAALSTAEERGGPGLCSIRTGLCSVRIGLCSIRAGLCSIRAGLCSIRIALCSIPTGLDSLGSREDPKSSGRPQVGHTVVMTMDGPHTGQDIMGCLNQ